MKKYIIDNNYFLACEILKKRNQQEFINTIDINLLQDKFIYYSSDYELYVILRLILYLYFGSNAKIYKLACITQNELFTSGNFNLVEMYYIIYNMDIYDFYIIMSKMDYYSSIMDKRHLHFIKKFEYNNIF